MDGDEIRNLGQHNKDCRVTDVEFQVSTGRTEKSTRKVNLFFIFTIREFHVQRGL